VPAKRCTQSLPFDPADPKAALAQLPHAAAVFALYGAEAHAEPYIGRTPNLRARLERLLQPSAKHPRRLQLAGRVRRIEWRLTGSEFESLLRNSNCSKRSTARSAWSACTWARRPSSASWARNAYPRITVTNRPSQREAGWAYGPFAVPRRSRALRRRGAQALPAAPLHLRSRSQSEPSRLRLLRDEDVPCAVLQGLHGRALPGRIRRRRELSGHARREPPGRRCAPSATKASTDLEFESSRGAPCAGAAGGSRARPGARAGAPAEPAARRDSAGLRNPDEVAVFLFEAACCADPLRFRRSA
jgi:hypothetical protein